MKTKKEWINLGQFIKNNHIPYHYNETDTDYEVYISDAGLVYYAIIEKTDPRNTDQIDFEDNFKGSSVCCKPLEPRSEDSKIIVRAESRPLNTTTVFIGRADSATDIGDGKELKWDFSNEDDDITPSGVNYKKKRMEFKFLDTVYVKEGAMYFYDKLKGSFLDLKIVAPTGTYYLDNEGNVHLATEDTVIIHYVRNHWMCGSCPMGDELNTESCSVGIPNYYKFWLEITVPASDTSSHGHISLEMYRERTVIL